MSIEDTETRVYTDVCNVCIRVHAVSYGTDIEYIADATVDMYM